LKYIADKNYPLEEAQQLINLISKLGPQECMALRQSQNAVILKEIKESLTYSTMLDEVCVVSVTKQLGLMIKSV